MKSSRNQRNKFTPREVKQIISAVLLVCIFLLAYQYVLKKHWIFPGYLALVSLPGLVGSWLIGWWLGGFRRAQVKELPEKF